MIGAPAVSSTNSFPTGFCSQKLQGLILLAPESWAGGLGVGLDLLTPGISSWTFIHYIWVRDQAILHLHPSNHLNGCSFFNSIVVRLPFNLISDGSEWWLFYNLIGILMWLWEEASHVCLCHHLARSSNFFFQSTFSCFSNSIPRRHWFLNSNTYAHN